MTRTDPIDLPAPFPLPASLSLASVSLQQRVQFAALLQLAQSGRAHADTTAAICAGADRRDLERALAQLLDDGSIAGPTRTLTSLVNLAEAGLLGLTPRGQLRLDEDDV